MSVESATSVLARTLGDPTRFTLVKSVPVFDEHEMEESVLDRDERGVPRKDAKGRPVMRTVVQRYDKERLQHIADNCNKRWESTQDLSPITIGHTLRARDGATELDQPPIVGYAKRFRVDKYGKDGRWCIYCDFYIRKGHEGALNEFPRRSVEIWKGEDILDPIALTRRTPRRDLGLTASYVRDNFRAPEGRYPLGRYSPSRAPSGRVCYAMEAEMPDDLAPEMAPEVPGAPEGGPGGEGDVSHDDKVDQYLRYMAGAPHSQYICDKYGMAPEGADAAPDVDPTMPPEADPDPEDYNMAALSNTNGAMPKPAPAGKDADQYTKPVQPRLAAPPRVGPTSIAESPQYKKMMADAQRARQEAEQYKRERDVAQATTVVDRLQSEGFMIDREAEIARLTPLDADGRKRREDEVRKYSRQEVAPISRDFLETGEPLGRMRPVDDEALPTEQECEAVYKYIREHPDMSEDYTKAFDLGLQEVRKRGMAPSR